MVDNTTVFRTNKTKNKKNRQILIVNYTELVQISILWICSLFNIISTSPPGGMCQQVPSLLLTSIFPFPWLNISIAYKIRWPSSTSPIRQVSKQIYNLTMFVFRNSWREWESGGKEHDQQLEPVDQQPWLLSEWVHADSYCSLAIRDG